MSHTLSELNENQVVRNFRITAADGKQYNAFHYNTGRFTIKFKKCPIVVVKTIVFKKCIYKRLILIITIPRVTMYSVIGGMVWMLNLEEVYLMSVS